jgi:cytochrome b involved in lipid metabolism
MKKFVSLALFIFFSVLVSIFTAGLFFSQGHDNGNQSATPANQSVTPSSSLSGSVLRSAEIAKHNSGGDCWLVIENKVYDVTSYLDSHPGGPDIIIRHCGQESTQAFNTKDSIFAKAHSAMAHQLLADYYIGDINQPRVK